MASRTEDSELLKQSLAFAEMQGPDMVNVEQGAFFIGQFASLAHNLAAILLSVTSLGGQGQIAVTFQSLRLFEYFLSLSRTCFQCRIHRAA